MEDFIHNNAYMSRHNYVLKEVLKETIIFCVFSRFTVALTSTGFIGRKTDGRSDKKI
jgi:hypothetical protein